MKTKPDRFTKKYSFVFVILCLFRNEMQSWFYVMSFWFHFVFSIFTLHKYCFFLMFIVKIGRIFDPCNNNIICWSVRHTETITSGKLTAEWIWFLNLLKRRVFEVWLQGSVFEGNDYFSTIFLWLLVDLRDLVIGKWSQEDIGILTEGKRKI